MFIRPLTRTMMSSLSTSAEPGKAHIAIVGAGIGGLTLARLLKAKNVPSTVYESKSKERFAANHGLWLGSETCNALLSELQVPFQDFRSKTAVTAEVDNSINDAPSSGLRVNKRRLLEYLSSDLDIQWEYQLKGVQASESAIQCDFKNGHSAQVVALIGADGVHSAGKTMYLETAQGGILTRRIVRSSLLPSIKPSVLPFVAINGQRRTPYGEFQAQHSSEDYRDKVTHKDDGRGAHLSTGLNDVKKGTAYHFFTYSRAAKEGGDALYKPDRSTAEANAIPSEFYDEIKASSFGSEINRETTKEDKMLSWLMRSISVGEIDMQALPSGVVLIGDAIHATPILGGDGAEQAIQDAIELSRLLSEVPSEEIPGRLKEFSRTALPRWKDSVKSSVSRLRQMHRSSSQL